MRDKINSQLGGLVGKKLRCSGRASNLFWLEFGEMITITRRDKTEQTAEYSLHIQCSWRITQQNTILTASRDFYSPNSECFEVDENFDWDIVGNNRFDERIKSFLHAVQNRLIVEKIDSDEIGGLKVFLSDNYVLEVFPDSSQDDEYSEFWRFFTRKDDIPHFVVTANGIEFN